MANKKTKKLIFSCLFFAIGLLSFFASILVGMFMSVPRSQIDYYKNDDNYKEIICVMQEPEYYSKDKYIFKSEENGSISLWEDNAVIAANNGFWDEVNVGDYVTVITAPGYFWDGYSQPIVGLKTENKVYLDFNLGKETHVAQLQKMRSNYLSVVIPIISIGGISIVLAVIMLVLLLKNKQSKQIDLKQKQ